MRSSPHTPSPVVRGCRRNRNRHRYRLPCRPPAPTRRMALATQAGRRYVSDAFRGARIRKDLGRPRHRGSDGLSQLVNTKGDLLSKIPLVTHRWDESGRVFLAGCSPAEPASASSIHLAYQGFYVSDPPAGPCVVRDCARGLRLPIHTIVCFKVGRFTLTQSSWTTFRRVLANGCLATLPLRWS